MSTTEQPTTNAAVRYTVNRLLTRGNVRGPAQTSRWYTAPVQLIDRDLDIIRLVQAFGQVRVRHVKAAFFADHADSTMYAVLKRLTQSKRLHIVQEPHPGGPKGGRLPLVYSLGPEGWKLFEKRRWYAPTAINYHALAVADAYAAALEYEHQGVIEVERVDVESYDVLGRTDVRPDLVLRFRVPAERKRRLIALEVDLATELRPKTIHEKLYKYMAAYRDSTKGFPIVVFLAHDKRRVAWLQRIINEGYVDSMGERVPYEDDTGKPLAYVFLQSEWPGVVL